MGKSTNRSSNKSSSKRNAPTNNNGRPRPMPYKAGVTKKKRRYDCGGKMPKGNSYKCGGKLKSK